MKRKEIIIEARTWLGTPWIHQASLKGIGCDCVGLVRGIFSKWGLAVDQNDLRYAPRPFHNTEMLYETCKKYASEIPLAEARLGDILLFGAAGFPAHHIGILSYDDMIIHTWIDVGRVVESRLDMAFRESLRYAFRISEVED